MSDSGLGYSDSLKAKVLARFKEGDKIFDIQYQEIFELDLKRDYFVIGNFPERFRFATENDVALPQDFSLPPPPLEEENSGNET